MVDGVKVSVCVVTYNHEKYIRECLQSLVNQNTNYKYEIIVGEDCSTDESRTIIDEFFRKYPSLFVKNYHVKNVGAVKNILSTYLLARGDYICHIDGDDFALPGKIEAQVKFLDENKDCNVVWSRAKVLDSRTGIVYDDLLASSALLARPVTKSDLMLIGSIACHSSKVFRRSTLKYLILPDGEFLDFYLDVQQLSNGCGYILDEFYCGYRAGIGISGSDNTKKLYLNDIERLVKFNVELKKYASANLFRFFLVELKNGKLNLKSISMFIRCFKFSTPYYFIKSLFYIKHFRSPIKL